MSYYTGEKMLSIFICDDQKAYLEKIYKVVHNAILMQDYDAEIVMATSAPQKIIDYLEEKKVEGLYFLDVDFKQNINGFNLANIIRKYDPRGFIVFITTHTEMSYMAFEYGVEALDYILKDMPQQMQPRIIQCITKAYERYCNKSAQSENIIQIKFEDKILNINLDEVLYISSSATVHKLELYTLNGLITFYGSLKNFQNELNKEFKRCHQSFIVNTNYILTIDKKKKEIILDLDKHKNKDKNENKNKELIIPISTKYFKDLLGDIN